MAQVRAYEWGTRIVQVQRGERSLIAFLPDAVGIWLYHCHISDHMLAGMSGRYEVTER
jgi:FtsP/CotA-like multicopper oxidase with cupredoxin domain